MSEFPYDINCDLGEEKNVEEQIMPLIQSANIACGAHAGNNDLIATCIRLAMSNKVKIGIHPSFPDRENFGRVVLDISDIDLLQSLKSQLDNFIEIAKKLSATIHHLKFHGALYNLVAKDVRLAEVIADFLEAYPKEWIIFCPPNSIFESQLLQHSRKVWPEAFLDRAYEVNGNLVSRKKEGAILASKELVFEQLKSLVKHQEVVAINQEKFSLKAKTFCIHGDHENAVEILKYIKAQYNDGKL